jgi:hypothetical protein
MTSKIPKDQWNRLVEEHRSGKTIAQIVRENDGVKKSTFRYHIKKANEDETQTQIEFESKPETKPESKPESESNIVPDIVQITKRVVPRVQVRDDFLTSFQPAKSQTKRSAVDALFGSDSLMGGSAVDSMFSVNDIFNPDTLKQVDHVPEKAKSALGKSKTWWLSGNKDKAPTKSELALKEDDEQLILVQKIRLYFVHFPELEKLHIVPCKRNTDTPETEKWLISLYSKKQEELEKILNFIRFHVRNNISENSSIKLASNVLETSVKVLEHVLLVVGVQSQNLTKNVMEDQDIIRCVKEILIDNSVTSLSLGPKSDIVLKLGMKIVSCDSQNRIEQKIESQARAKAKVKADYTSPLTADLAERYKDL